MIQMYNYMQYRYVTYENKECGQETHMHIICFIVTFQELAYHVQVLNDVIVQEFSY